MSGVAAKTFGLHTQDPSLISHLQIRCLLFTSNFDFWNFLL